MTDNHRVVVGDFFFNVELERTATDVRRAGNVFFVPFVFVTNIYNDCVAAV